MQILTLRPPIRITNQLETRAFGKKMRPEPWSLVVFSNFERKQNTKNNLLDSKHSSFSKERLALSLSLVSFYLENICVFRNVSDYKGKDGALKKVVIKQIGSI